MAEKNSAQDEYARIKGFSNMAEEDVPAEIYWCHSCRTPIIRAINDANRFVCPICGRKTNYLCTDVRPVFPEERLLIEILRGKPLAYIGSSVWASINRYYIDGETSPIPSKLFSRYSPDVVREKLNEYGKQNSYEMFNRYISQFVKANKFRFDSIKDEAYRFIQSTAAPYPRENIVISFSGGKDSAVTADLVVRALSDPCIVHIFGNTTLEFPLTLEYVKRFKAINPRAIFKTAMNKEQIFTRVCDDIGPPARMMRWCCSMFKTGPITRVLNSLYRDKDILTFYGIRKCESISRSKYHRVEGNSESVKIQKQKVASPVFYWKNADIWLYLLTEKIDFNDAYRLGYDRVGCWCCPNNSLREQSLSQIYMPEKSKRWRDFLICFAKRIGKPDPDVYIDTGKWKARQGGNGLTAANDVKIRFANCTTEDNAKIYRINKPVTDSLINMFVPFGRIAPELGRRLINETIVLDLKSNVPILSIQPFDQNSFEYAVKVKTMNVSNHGDLQRMVGYQIKKYNACRKCLKCESLCRYGAISITADEYRIDPNKCRRCKMCVTAKYLDGGCLMDKYLKTKE